MFTTEKREEKEHRCQVTLTFMLGIEYIICSMASQCVSAKSALHPLGFRSDIADTHLEAMLYNYITYYRSDLRSIYSIYNLTTNGGSCYHHTIYIYIYYIYHS